MANGKHEFNIAMFSFVFAFLIFFFFKPGAIVGMSHNFLCRDIL